MKTLVEIHALQNFAPSNLNRDDTGAPKDAFFGGRRRARISSQCFKRAIREFFKEQNDSFFSDRTKRLVDELIKKLSEKIADTTPENMLKAIEAALNCIGTGDKTKVKVVKDKKTGQVKTDVLLFLSPAEVQSLTEAIAEAFTELVKGKASKETVQRVKDALDGKNSKSRLTLDIALFGRMLAVMPEKNQYAACQVAHAISTNAVEREFDFYTAVDDLKPEDTSGADMMGTVEFNSACFYRYAAVDAEKLVENLGGNRELALEGLGAFLEGFVVAEPTGKQNSFAAHNPAEFVGISIRSGSAPQNLANAFEVPVFVRGNESLTGKSAVQLGQKKAQLAAAYGQDAACFHVNLTQDDVAFGDKKESLREAIDAVLDTVKKGA